MTRTLLVDPDRCRGDGLCVAVCPKQVLEIADKRARAVESRVRHCLACGQCMAICVHDAIEVEVDEPGLAAVPFPQSLTREIEANLPRIMTARQKRAA